MSIYVKKGYPIGVRRGGYKLICTCERRACRTCYMRAYFRMRRNGNRAALSGLKS